MLRATSRILRVFGPALWVLSTAPTGTSLAIDCNENGRPDHEDIESGRSLDCDRNAVPDECDLRPVNYGLEQSEHLGIRASPAALADLDGDGDLDLVSTFGREFLLRLNRGDGSFGDTRTFPIPFGGFHLLAVELNGDDRDEVVLFRGQVHVFVSEVEPLRFREPQEFDLGVLPVDGLDGDFDSDGLRDLAIATLDSIVILRGRPGGGLEASDPVPAASHPRTITGGDFDGDGDLDLATGNADRNLSIFLNRGAEGFVLTRNFASVVSLEVLRAADLDADGLPELVGTGKLSGATEGLVTVHRNLGDRFSLSPDLYPVYSEPRSLIIADLDRDGTPDLAVGHRNDSSPDRGVGVLLNTGEGRFAAAVQGGAMRSAWPLLAGDLEGDGVPELVAGDVYGPGRDLVILRRRLEINHPDCDANGVPDPCQLGEGDCNRNGIPDGCDVASGASADCDENGLPDECDPDCNGTGLPDDCDLDSGASTDCNGNGLPDDCDVDVGPVIFTPSPALPGLLDARVALGDLDGDGDLDILNVRAEGSTRAYLNDGRGRFQPGRSSRVGRNSQILSIDRDDDGIADLATVEARTVSLHGNRGGGDFELVQTIEISLWQSGLEVRSADVDGDGDPDLAVHVRGGFRVEILTNEGGLFTSASEVSLAGAWGNLTLADVTGDRKPDLLLGSENRILLLRNDGRGDFGSAEVSPSPLRDAVLLGGDYDGDGDTDLLATSPRVSSWLLRNDGEGRFLPAAEPVAGGAPSAVAAGDLDRDGDLDLVYVRHTFARRSPVWQPLLNTGSGAFRLREEQLVDESRRLTSLAVADVDADGLSDVVITTDRVCQVCRIPDGEPRIGVFLNRSAPPFSRDDNRNRFPDECESSSFRRGDANDDGRTDLSDAVAVLSHLFLGEAHRLRCEKSGDVDDGGVLDLSDAVYLLRHLLLGGPAPLPPFEDCGPDPTADALRCDLPAPCR